ncbi:DUF7287 family protein [Methanosalsum natronophilum]|uniref:DUF7287 family protein n=1 Tax=Methanosalsum natronophilum TaxID=768733 RepID=UPI00216A47A4|nr:hypothetical protein [Methanosalsum natronophilum]MCS3923364.1 hypothetical protein [Methanosalsum natronophilum]
MVYERIKCVHKRFWCNDRGQLTIDYLVAIIIFMAAVFFVLQYTASLYLPFHSSSDDVNIIIDRISGNVMEQRISESDLESGYVISPSKKQSFFTDLNNDYDSVREELGLIGSHRSYDINISVIDSSNNVISTSGAPVPSRGDIGQIRRIGLYANPTSESGHELVSISFRIW